MSAANKTTLSSPSSSGWSNNTVPLHKRKPLLPSSLLFILFTFWSGSLRNNYSNKIMPSVAAFSAVLRRQTLMVNLNCHNIRPTQKLFMSTHSNSENHSDECPLAFESLPYRGAEVRLSSSIKNQKEDESFLQNLGKSIEYWKKHVYTSAWIHVPSSRASLVEKLTSCSNGGVGCGNFEMHHVNTTEQTIVLKQWLLPDKEDKIPPLATHQVGCAGLVLSENNEILLVKEWQGGYSDRVPSKQWKLPGGLLDAGESFGDASCREVFEETGIQTKFQSILSFWHRHGLTFGKSDLYVVCLLHPTADVSTDSIKVDPMEISDAKWMPIEEFLQTQNHPLILHVLENAFHLTKNDHSVLKQKRIEQKRLQPIAPILEGAVQWPNRHPYPTYTARLNR